MQNTITIMSATLCQNARKRRERVSLCMIVKNEEERLDYCLRIGG